MQLKYDVREVRVHSKAAGKTRVEKEFFMLSSACCVNSEGQWLWGVASSGF